MLDDRNASKHRRVNHDFAFSGLIACGHCGCSLVGEIKKQRYIYYHCTGYKGKCDEPYGREEVLEKKFGALLGGLAFDDEVLDWLRDALHESHADERREQELPLIGYALSTTGSRTAFMQLTSINSTVSSVPCSSRRCPQSGEPSASAACETSSGIRAPTSHASMTACAFSNWPGTPNGCSRSRMRAGNVGC